MQKVTPREHAAQVKYVCISCELSMYIDAVATMNISCKMSLGFMDSEAT